MEDAMKINAETQAIAQSLAEQIGRMSDSEAEGPEANAIRRRLNGLVGEARAEELIEAASNVAGLSAAARLTPTQVDEAAREYLHGWDTPDPVQATATHGLSPVDAECLAEAYGPRDGRRVGRALVALCRSRSNRTLAARALRAIPSEARSEQSRSNGRRRTSDPVHVTRIGAGGGAYGHSTRGCDSTGCAGIERFLGTIDGAEAGHVYEVKAGRIVAEIV